jgi:hypothetical protein
MLLLAYIIFGLQVCLFVYSKPVHQNFHVPRSNAQKSDVPAKQTLLTLFAGSAMSFSKIRNCCSCLTVMLRGTLSRPSFILSLGKGTAEGTPWLGT